MQFIEDRSMLQLSNIEWVQHLQCASVSFYYDVSDVLKLLSRSSTFSSIYITGAYTTPVKNYGFSTLGECKGVQFINNDAEGDMIASPAPE